MKNFIKIVIGLLVFVYPLFPQSNEAWVKYERDGKAFGYEHIEVFNLENGNTRYNIYQVIKIEGAGFSQEIIQDGYYIVDKYFKPVSLQFNIVAPPNKIALYGKCENEILFLTKDYESGDSQQFEIPMDYVYFDVVIGKVILWKRYEKEYWLKVFNPLETRVNEYLVKIKRTTVGGFFATLKERITINMLIDSQGIVKKIVFKELGANAVLTDSIDTKEIGYLKTDNELTLTIKNEPTIPNFYDVEKAIIQVKWKDLSFTHFKFEDCRQKEIKREENKNNFTVTLDIQKPPDMKIKTSQMEYRKSLRFLEETEFIKPDSPSIQTKLKEIRSNVRGGNYSLVKEILLWTYGNIKATHIVEKLSGPEVLKKGIGKCSEYAALFSSLTRAAGIPTKIAFGVSQIGDMWTGHIWCEVWLGEWLAVDPSNGIFIINPSHIKFTDSSTLIDYQYFWWRLVDNLRIQVLEFK